MMNRILQTSGFLSEKNYVAIIPNQEVINIQSERTTFLKSDGLTSASPIRDPHHTIFSARIFHVKRPQLSETTKIITSSS